MFSYLEPDNTCVLVLNQQVIYESKENSVKPLIKYLYHNGLPDRRTILIDKIIGLAIANVVLYCNLETVYAKTVSLPALTLLKNNNVTVYYENLVPNILRRDRTDICPLEKCIGKTRTPLAAYQTLVEIVINNNPVHLNNN